MLQFQQAGVQFPAVHGWLAEFHVVAYGGSTAYDQCYKHDPTAGERKH